MPNLWLCSTDNDAPAFQLPSMVATVTVTLTSLNGPTAVKSATVSKSMSFFTTSTAESPVCA